MRKIWTLALIAIIGLIGCDKENVKSDNDEYYVKYEVDGATIYSGEQLNAIINTEDNTSATFVISATAPWEMTIGPVKKGFNAILNVAKVGSDDSHLTLYVQISVSKNGSPFALKQVDGSSTVRNSVQINYTIDY